jgi:3-methylcrotonyl-CoA carboxylase alpha subunit
MNFNKLLIANRGEVAVRIIRACKELGIRTVAVYSEADEGAMHVRLADEAYLLGPAEATESYLNVERISEVIEESGAEVVHPGYGFLSESAGLARAVEEAGAVWAGPPAEAMEKVGDKIQAKELARNADVPTIPGYSGEEQDEERLAEEAEGIGYPVLVKASAGGGGRGMRPVYRAQDFVEAVRGARREAESAFGEGSVFLEKLVENPRHVEVQIMGDNHGNVVHLYERECSIQRRHQKVVEEAPSPALGDELRESICAAAVRLAHEAGYRNAGTVEFLLSGEEEEFYFLEMNARLQVEHPVTELVTGLDLVHLQLSVAAGEELPISQGDVTLRGSAIEVRLYTEEEGTGLPAGGKLRLFAPSEGPGIRNDTGVETGDEVTLHYDPMIAKLIVFASDREKAVLRLRRALGDYEVLGVPTNLPLLRRIADHPSFEAGETTIDFLEEHGLTEAPPAPSPPEETVLLAAAGELSRSPTRRRPDDLFSAGPWRLQGAIRLRYHAGEEEHAVEVERSRGKTLKLHLDGREADVEVLSVGDGEIQARVDGRQVTGGFATDNGDVLVSLDGESYRLSKPSPPDVDDAGAGGGDAGGASLTAPMPGTVVKVLVGEGDEVEEGQLLLVLEAMKTEHSIAAPHNGVVSSLPYGEGASVPGGDVLVELEETGQGAEDE